MSEQKTTQDFVCTQYEDNGKQTICNVGPCKLTVRSGIIPYRCANFHSNEPVWVHQPAENAASTDEVKASDDATDAEREETVPVANTTSVTYEGYEKFQDKIVPEFAVDFKTLFIQDKNNIEAFCQGMCSHFRPRCHAISCGDCLLVSDLDDVNSVSRRLDWLKAKGYIEDSENISPVEASDIDDICAMASNLETKIIDNLGCTASPEEIVEFLKGFEPSVDELYALIAVKLTH